MQISLQEVMFLLLEWFGATFAMDLKKKPNLATISFVRIQHTLGCEEIIFNYSGFKLPPCEKLCELIYWRIIHRMLKYFIFEHATKISCKTFSKTTKNVVLKTQDSHKNNQSCKTQTNAKLVSYIVLNKRDRLLFELKAQ